MGDAAAQEVTLNFPTNTSTTADMQYSLKASLDGTEWSPLTGAVTVSKATMQAPVINTLVVAFETNGGNAIVSQHLNNGGKATEPAPPAKTGYTFVSWYTDQALTTAFDFNTAITHNLTLYAKWTKIHLCAAFTDIVNHWAKDAICYVVENGLFTGTTPTTFSPDTTMTRGMLVTVLWRLEGSPAAADGDDFADVVVDAWYAQAVAWASQNDIVGGTGNGLFSPEDDITREQIVVTLFEYHKFKGDNVTATGTLNSYSDSSNISSWAQEAMLWAVGAGIITGRSGNLLEPQGTASRAETAAILQRDGLSS